MPAHRLWMKSGASGRAVKADRDEIVAESYIWISSFIAEDSAEMYVDDEIYKPSTYIKIKKP